MPLEWNVYMIFGAFVMFTGHDARFGLGDLRAAGAGRGAVMAVVVDTVVIGNLHPRRVSFLPGMRYYAGNWDVSCGA